MNKKFYGYEIGEYGVENGYVDFRTLSQAVGDAILNNTVINVSADNWDVINGELWDENDDPIEVFQWYIITENGADLLSENTNEIVMYNGELDMYLWGVTHYGTAWDYVLTDIKID